MFSTNRNSKKKPKIEYRPAQAQSTTSHNQNQTQSQSISQFRIKTNYFFKILLVTIIWLLTGYSYIRAVDLIHCSDVIILYSVNFSFIYMAKWIILHHLFIPLRVNNIFIYSQKFQKLFSVTTRCIKNLLLVLFLLFIIYN